MNNKIMNKNKNNVNNENSKNLVKANLKLTNFINSKNNNMINNMDDSNSKTYRRSITSNTMNLTTKNTLIKDRIPPTTINTTGKTIEAEKISSGFCGL